MVHWPRLKNLTITLSDEAALWVTRKAAAQGTSVSRFVGHILDEQMRRSDEYWRAYERWKSLETITGNDAKHRLGRGKAHERRCL
jgi:hypothetical protein